jgi:hypothetical protein
MQRWLVAAAVFLGTALVAAQDNPTPTPEPVIVMPPALLDYGDFITASTNVDQPGARYTFQGQAGDIIRVRAESPAFPTRLLLRNSADETLLLVDAFPGHGTAWIRDVALPATDTYRLIITRPGGGAAGAFTLALEQLGSVLEAAPPLLESLSLEMEIVQQAGDPLFRYPLLLAPGHVVTIQVSAVEGVMPSVSFSGPEGIPNLTLQTDAETGLATLPTYGITQAGIHEIGFGSETARVTLRVEVRSLHAQAGT